jgi:hypothetical protein
MTVAATAVQASPPHSRLRCSHVASYASGTNGTDTGRSRWRTGRRLEQSARCDRLGLRACSRRYGRRLGIATHHGSVRLAATLDAACRSSPVPQRWAWPTHHDEGGPTSTAAAYGWGCVVAWRSRWWLRRAGPAGSDGCDHRRGVVSQSSAWRGWAPAAHGLCVCVSGSQYGGDSPATRQSRRRCRAPGPCGCP